MIEIRAKVQEAGGELIVSAHGEVARRAVPKEFVAWMRAEGLAVQREGSNVYDVDATCEIAGNLLHVHIGGGHRVLVLDNEKASWMRGSVAGLASTPAAETVGVQGALWSR